MTLAPPATPEALLAHLDDLGIGYRLHRHPAAATVAEAKRHCSHLPGGHFKNLFLRSKKKRSWLVVMEDIAVVDLEALGEQLGSGKLSFARPERLEADLGVKPGSVTPLALINDPQQQVEVVLDDRLLNHEVVNFHPLINTATVALAPADLLAFIRHCGHEPRLVTLPLVERP